MQRGDGKTKPNNEQKREEKNDRAAGHQQNTNDDGKFRKNTEKRERITDRSSSPLSSCPSRVRAKTIDNLVVDNYLIVEVGKVGKAAAAATVTECIRRRWCRFGRRRALPLRK